MAIVTASTYLTIPPNWRNGFRLRKIYKTAISKALKCPEQRNKIYSYCRLGVSYTITLLDYYKTNEIAGLLSRITKTVCGIPIWCNGAMLNADAMTGASAVSVVESTYSGFIVGERAIILNLNDWTSFDVVVVSEIEDEYIAFGPVLSMEYSSGAMIYPLRDMFVTFNAKINHFTPSIAEFQVNAVERLLDESDI